jgi:hypothetical protein
MSQSTRVAADIVENRPGVRAPTPRAPAITCAPSLRAQVFAQLTRMLAQLAQS